MNSFIILPTEMNEKDIKELKNILENKKVINIVYDINNDLKTEIFYTDEQIPLNKNHNLKVQLIRNKYYRKLLETFRITNNVNDEFDNINYEINDINNEIDNINYEIDDDNDRINEYNGIISEDKNNLLNLSKISKIDNIFNIDNVDNNDIFELKKALINYLGTYNFDNIFELTKDEMEKLIEYKWKPKIDSPFAYKISDTLGMYCHNDEELFNLLESESKVDKKSINEMLKCNRFIIICPELIQDFCVNHINEFNKLGIDDSFELYNIIFNKTLVHEIGHGVFEYLFDEENERRANYFVSITFDGVFDNFIKVHTDIQGGLYKNPVLINDDDISVIYKI